MADVELAVKVDVSGQRDVDKLGKSFEDGGKSADRLSTRAIAAGSAIGTFVGGAALQLGKAGLDFAIEKVGDSIDLASAKAESASKVNTLYGSSAVKLSDAAATAADTVNMSSGKYLEAAGNLGNLERNMGLSEKASANMSVGMIQLAGDMGSFNNASPEDVLKAMTSALVGQSEPMKKYGVMLDAATVKGKAMEMGLYDGTGAIDKSAVAQATYQLMLDQTGQAQGDLARTSDGLANKQARGAAKQEEAWTQLGEAIMPLAAEIMPVLADVVTIVVGIVVDAIKAIKGWIDANQPLIQTVMHVAGVLIDVLMKAIDIVLKIVGKLIDIWKVEIDIFRKVFDVITSLGGKIFGPLIDGIKSVMGWFKDLWGTISSTAGKIAGALGDLMAPLGKSFDKVIGIIKSGWNTFARFWNSIGISIPEVRIPNPLGGDVVIGGGKFNLPNLPVLDRGGIVTGPTLALLSANSRPEAVVPLDRLGGSSGITVNVYAGVGDPVAIGRQVVEAVRAYERANGPAWKAA
jgi:hypothetical protein